ncbi:cupin domain-containing protein [Oceanisphaera sp.]|uniref:cupin domain-containing protein n=1 Tax=Oceanisphaera sp. TaxID=1929979 RepID=UPI003A9287F6
MTTVEQQGSDDMSNDVGVRLKAVRTLRNISQRELAKRTGVTHSSLSLIEQGKVSPSVSSLKKILDGIPMTVGEFFTLDLQNTDQTFYSADELQDVGSDDLSLKLVGYNRKNRAMSFIIETYPPGADTGHDMMAYRGEEAGVVIEGEVEVIVGGQVRLLQEGDSYYFSTTLPHRFRNNSDRPCRVVSCSTPAKHF